MFYLVFVFIAAFTVFTGLTVCLSVMYFVYNFIITHTHTHTHTYAHTDALITILRFPIGVE